VASVTLEVGELNLIEDEQLRFWVRELAARDGSPDVEVKISHPAGRVRCEECGMEGRALLPGGEMGHLLPPVVACEACGSRNVRIEGGRELRVVSAEIEMEGHSGDNT